ncbi:MAG: IclR family transcriptional regulator [Spirochaetota bacterium]
MIFIAVAKPRSSLSMHISVGTGEPAYSTALGKVLIAFMHHKKKELLLRNKKLRKYTPKTITSIDAYKKHLDSVVHNKYAIDNEEYRLGVVCIAAPVFNHRGVVDYSIGISGSREQICPTFDKYISIVKDAGAQASRLLGMSMQ